MASSGQRNFSFQRADDDPQYHPLTPQQQMATHQEYHDPAWQQQQQQNPAYDSYQSPQQYQQPPLERQASTSTLGSFAARDEFSNTVGNRNSGTVIRKAVAPAAAATAAAALATVRNDLAPPAPSHGPIDRGYTPPPHDNAYFSGAGGDAGYGTPRSAEHTPGSLQYPPSVGTPHSHAPLLAAAPMPGWPERPSGSSERVYQDPIAGHYTDNPYQRSSTLWDPALQGAAIDGSAELVVSDDEDDYGRRHKKGGAAAAAAAAAAAGGAYAAGSGGGLRGGGVEGGGLLRKSADGGAEKSLYTAKEARTNNKKKWILWILGIVCVLAIAGGTAAGVLLSKGGDDDKASKSGNTAAGGGGIDIDAKQDVALNGDLDKNSKEIKELMDNSELHKVFHGIDYTPLNAVYPECVKWVPSQNNITRDIAVMSLLTDKIRLYGNDCNQTEMVFHAIDRLEVDMKVWIGVWLDGNTTTNARQLHQLWEIVDMTEHHDKIDGIAVGNEVLFSEYLTETELTTVIEEVRANLTDRDYDIPVGTSDLGSNWNADMASKVDVLMANVHPFFAGVTADKAADWTYTFFEENDVAYTLNLATPPRVMISEVGWPSGGGKNNGSVAGIDEFNTFMEDFVCTENKRGTEYFWFSAFDEPWKMKYNQPDLGEEWEDKWGLMDVNRVLKDGLKIPTCK